MKSYNEFVNEKFDYTKQRKPYKTYKTFSEIDKDDFVYFLNGAWENKIKINEYKIESTTIKNGFVNIHYEYKYSDHVYNQTRENCCMAVMTYKGCIRRITATDKNLLNLFLKSKYFNDYLKLVKSYADTELNLDKLIDEFLETI